MKLKSAFSLWQSIVGHIPKIHRYTFGAKVENLFLLSLEILFRAQYAKMEEKTKYLDVAIGKIDLLKFFIQIGWENRMIDSKKYEEILVSLQEVGRMLGGWKKGLEAKLSPRKR